MFSVVLYSKLLLFPKILAFHLIVPDLLPEYSVLFCSLAVVDLRLCLCHSD